MISSGKTEQSRAWQHFADGFERLRPPLRPTPRDLDTLRAAIAGHDEVVLLLGVTPELASLGEYLVATDKEAQMLTDVWPGDDQRRRALVANWLSLPFDAGSFDAVIGDGSLNVVAEQREELIIEVGRVLAPGGVVALRVYCAPEQPETLIGLRDEVESGCKGNVHSLAWRIGMSIAADRPLGAVAVREIAHTFNALFPDREALEMKTGWSSLEIAFFDRLEAGAHSMGFPTVDGAVQLLQRIFPQCRVIPGSGYPLAERCPTIVCSGRA